MAREPITKERELYEELSSAIAAATAPMNGRDFRAWARVILTRHKLGQPVSNYALDCARQAVRASASPTVAHSFVSPVEHVVAPARPANPLGDDWANGYESILEAAQDDA